MFSIHENLCVDNSFKASKHTLLAKRKTLGDAIIFANKFMQENIVEYGYHISDSCLKINKGNE